MSLLDGAKPALPSGDILCWPHAAGHDRSEPSGSPQPTSRPFSIDGRWRF